MTNGINCFEPSQLHTFLNAYIHIVPQLFPNIHQLLQNGRGVLSNPNCYSLSMAKRINAISLLGTYLLEHESTRPSRCLSEINAWCLNPLQGNLHANALPSKAHIRLSMGILTWVFCLPPSYYGSIFTHSHTAHPLVLQVELVDIQFVVFCACYFIL